MHENIQVKQLQKPFSGFWFIPCKMKYFLGHCRLLLNFSSFLFAGKKWLVTYIVIYLLSELFIVLFTSQRSKIWAALYWVAELSDFTKNVTSWHVRLIPQIQSGGNYYAFISLLEDRITKTTRRALGNKQTQVASFVFQGSFHVINWCHMTWKGLFEKRGQVIVSNKSSSELIRRNLFMLVKRLFGKSWPPHNLCLLLQGIDRSKGWELRKFTKLGFHLSM